MSSMLTRSFDPTRRFELTRSFDLTRSFRSFARAFFLPLVSSTIDRTTWDPGAMHPCVVPSASLPKLPPIRFTSKTSETSAHPLHFRNLRPSASLPKLPPIRFSSETSAHPLHFRNLRPSASLPKIPPIRFTSETSAHPLHFRNFRPYKTNET
jgi:hypothetical protein